MTTSTKQCIHGFSVEQCGSCRTCQHGLSTAACGRCNAPVRTRKAAEPVGDRSTHEHAGHEIFYEPAVSGWRYRAPDAAASELSYRSAFLARKAVDARITSGPDAAPAPSKRRAGRKG
jgi:hypothetical protein